MTAVDSSYLWLAEDEAEKRPEPRHWQVFEVLPESDLVPSGWPSVEAEPSLAVVSNADYEAPQDCEKVVKPDFLVE